MFYCYATGAYCRLHSVLLACPLVSLPDRRRLVAVHGGNFRGRRTARLRQFVTHKPDQTHQYGPFGTVGCGRCITWCPTGIDLTEMAKEVQRSESA